MIVTHRPIENPNADIYKDFFQCSDNMINTVCISRFGKTAPLLRHCLLGTTLLRNPNSYRLKSLRCVSWILSIYLVLSKWMNEGIN